MMMKTLPCKDFTIFPDRLPKSLHASAGKVLSVSMPQVCRQAVVLFASPARALVQNSELQVSYPSRPESGQIAVRSPKVGKEVAAGFEPKSLKPFILKGFKITEFCS